MFLKNLIKLRPLTLGAIAVFAALTLLSAMAEMKASLANEQAFADVKPGEWKELPDTKLKEVFPKQEGHPAWGVVGPRSVTATWSGAALDTKRNVLIVTGGGHTDYGGNEVYEFDIAARKWSRVTEPSAMKPLAQPGRYAVVDSEAPVSSHTYDGLVYLPLSGQMFKYGGSNYRSGELYDPHAYLYHPAERRWKRGAKAPYPVLEVTSDYDVKNNKVIVGTGGGVMEYQVATDTWKLLPQHDSVRPFGVGTIDPDRNLFVQVDATTKALHYYQLGAAPKRQIATLSGESGWGPHPGIAYHGPSKRMVLWNGGREVWAVNTSRWTVQKYDNVNQPAPVPTFANGERKSWGIYGRWQYVPDYDIFIAYNDTGDNVWLYKLPDSQAEQAHKVSECRVDICVGPGRRYTKPSEAAVVAKDGDTVEIDAGIYPSDAAVWRTNNLTIRGAGERPHIQADGASAQGKGTWVIKGSNITVENIEFSGAKVPDKNGAGIRLEGSNLTVRRCYFHHNQNGILTGVNDKSDILIERSEFAYNGFGDGYSHNIYVGRVNSLTVRFSYLHHANVGHNLKTRAYINHIAYNRIMDEAEGNSSYAVNIPNGGLSYLIGNIIQQGPKTENSTMISYGEEGLLQPRHGVYLINNTLVNDVPLNARFIRVENGLVPKFFVNNIYAGPGKFSDDPQVLAENLAVDRSVFVAPDRYDYRLKPGAPGIDAARHPGDANGLSLYPAFQYVHNADSAPRKMDTVLDMGAFEN